MRQLAFVVLVCAASVYGQDDNEKVSVPLHDPARPAHISADLLMGNITVQGADVKDVTVEAHGRSQRERHETRTARADGLKRLDWPGSAGLDITEDNNTVTIKTSMWRNGDLTITVPRNSSLRLRCVSNGHISVQGVNGEIDANDLNGGIVLTNVGGSVIAHSLNGTITAVLDRVDPAKPMSFSTMNGEIDVSLPDSVRANVSMKTDNGEIYSDFEVKLQGSAQLQKDASGRQANGSYHLRFDRTLHGTINGGGPEYQFTSFNGQIYIRKKK